MKISNLSSTKMIHAITEKYGEDRKQELMKELKVLRSEIRYELYLKVRHYLLPLTDHGKFEQLLP